MKFQDSQAFHTLTLSYPRFIFKCQLLSVNNQNFIYYDFIEYSKFSKT
jgi:hypothetical protein